jgi:hypothetical protein
VGTKQRKKPGNLEIPGLFLAEKERFEFGDFDKIRRNEK